MSQHKYDLGVIGNCAYMAHIDKQANVKWLCWPRFDSSFIFGGLLDEEKGGRYSIIPEGELIDTYQYYIENTNILCTEFETSSGWFRVTDFAPRFFQYDRHYKPLMFVRKIEPLSSRPRIKVICKPVDNYGKTSPTVYLGSNHINYSGLSKPVRLTTNIPLTYILEEQSFVLTQPTYLVLTYGNPLEAPLTSTIEEFLRKTKEHWLNWTKRANIGSFYQKQLLRSALVLKLHQYEDTGAIIASSTTSLPEFPESGRTWDYRYCWIRDTYYTLNAFKNIGHSEELESYFRYIENVISSEPARCQPLYGIDGRKDITEEILDLGGYQGNTPVRIGNQAHQHIQNDVYGQVLVTLFNLYVDRRFSDMASIRSKDLIYKLLEKIQEVMDMPDAGLWEFRTSAQKHCYTYLFHWAGSLAALKVARHFKDDKMANLALSLKEKAAAYIEACKIPETGAYAQAVGSTQMDASTLQLITMNYLDPNSEAARVHLAALEKELKVDNGLFYRYKHADDFGKPKTTFLICAYWYVEALACVGRVAEAKQYFDNLLQYGNHLGLLSEDVEAATGSQWGNFPQTYSHVGQLNTAFRIAKKLDLPDFYTV